MRRLLVVLGAAALLGLVGWAGAGRGTVPARGPGGRRGRRPRATSPTSTRPSRSCRPRTASSCSSSSSTASTAWTPSSGCSRREELSGLGGNDALLAVAVEDGAYGFDVPDGADVTRDEADQLAGQAVEPEFADGDWEAGVVAFADILRTGEAPDSGDGGGGGALLVARRDRGRRWRRLPAGPVAAPQAGGAAPAGAADREARPLRRDDDRGAAGPGEQRPAASSTRP